ncbi:hypothetical protein RZE82_01525 [Mollicutes bacterium LVI A0039]|nr:hypothetical protein RZE82_01525 [Mollicutes bacterium LVI A0039]
MFNDFKKMNGLNFYLTIIISIVYLISIGISAVLLITKDSFDDPFLYITIEYVQSIAFYIIAAVFVIFVLKATTGLKREILLMYRGRNYYLKMQFMTICAYSILLTGLRAAILFLGKLLQVNLAELEMVFNFTPVNTLSITFVLIILSYYFMIYVSDIFFNTNTRYNSFKVRLMHTILFMSRALVITIASLILLFEYSIIGIDWYNPIKALVFIPDNPNAFTLSIFTLMVMTICLIIDYSCHFKKKVII